MTLGMIVATSSTLETSIIMLVHNRDLVYRMEQADSGLLGERVAVHFNALNNIYLFMVI